MKSFKSFLRIWLAASSSVVFAATWIVLGHSPKPINSRYNSPQAYVTPLPTLAPFQPLSHQANGWALMPQNNRSISRPVFMTGGS